MRRIACVLALAGAAACAEDEAELEGGAELVEETVAELLRDPGETYDRASPVLRRDRQRGSFVAQAGDLALVLGPFEGVEGITEVELTEGARRRSARLSAELAFERDSVSAELSFEEVKGDWRLLGLELPIPPSLVEAWDDAGAARAAGPAPESAIEAASAILRALGEEDVDKVPGASESAAAAAQRAEEEFGAYRRTVKTSWSRVDASGQRARMTAILAYERRWVRGEIELSADGEREPPWRIESLRIVDPKAIGSSGGF